MRLPNAGAMPVDVLNAIASVGTLLVIAVTAVAALVQLRHLRVSNQQQSLLALGEQYQDIAPLISFVYDELPKKMESAEFRNEIGRVLNRQTHPELIVAGFFDQLGALVRFEMMEEEIVLEFAGGSDAILKCWNNLSRVIAIRRSGGSNAYANFEFLASRAARWEQRHPQGTYPSSEPRMKLPEP